ncbi:MAG: cysteine desulfurase NifS, partial [Betaproteobacteria bacterium HGW-Betaproteobacteria-21]
SCVTEAYGNPSSSYPLGRQACAIVDGARRSVAELIGADADELYFTGCATEANNLALLGVARALGSAKRHLVVSAIEHPAIMEPAQQLKREGWSLTVVPVDHYGRVSVADVEASMRPDTALVSIMHANNEIGTIQPIREISEIMRRNGVLLHTDAAQSVGKIPVDVQTLGVDLLTLAGHKFYATKGIGALYVRRGTPITNILFGAGQERGLRPGTENVPAIAGLGAASRLARERLPSVEARLGAMRDALHERLQASIPGLQLNGDSNDRLPNTLNLSFPAVSGRALVQAVSDHVAASVGSACHSEADAVSGVLAAIGCDGARAASAVRLSTGWPTTVDEIERAADALVTAWRQLARP